MKLSKIDQLSQPDHTYLEDGDECFYLGEYISNRPKYYRGFTGEVKNLKKKVRDRNQPHYRYKGQAIRSFGRQLRAVLGQAVIESWTFVPVPPSKAKGDPEYDDRMIQLLGEIGTGFSCDTRELVVQTASRNAMHTTEGRRLRPAELARLWSLDEGCALPEPSGIVIFDDVLTTGSSFKAMEIVLSRRFPSTSIIGLFVARRIWDRDDDEEGDLLF